MGLFKRQSEVKAKPEAEEPLIYEVYRLLDQIGLLRIQIFDPKVKVCITQIAWNGIHKLTGGSADTTPDTAIIEFRGHLESVLRAVTQYINFQNNTSQYEDAEEMMMKGRNAIVGFARYVMTASAPGGTRETTTFKVDTAILSAQQHR